MLAASTTLEYLESSSRAADPVEPATNLASPEIGDASPPSITTSNTSNTSTTSQNVFKTVTRQRIHKPAPPLPVPDINEDAAERKRVLNVLAQRRYRDRKRQIRKAAAAQKIRIEQPQDGQVSTPLDYRAQTASNEPSEPDFPSLVLEEIPVQLDSFQDITPGLAFDNLVDLDLCSTWQAVSLELASSSTDTGQTLLPCASLEVDSIPESEVTTTNSDLASPWPPPPTTIDPASLGLSPASLPSTAISPDSYVLPINELSLLKAWMRISSRLGVTDAIWELTAQSPFTSTSENAWDSDLPEPWQPTTLQTKLAHHPIVDFIPWPSARDKVLQLMHLPANMKPKAARDPMAVVFLAYDLEDGSEGLRISGDDPYDARTWEIGQLVFEKWWFIFDRDIVNQSNRLRKARGASVLRMNGSTNA